MNVPARVVAITTAVLLLSACEKKQGDAVQPPPTPEATNVARVALAKAVVEDMQAKLRKALTTAIAEGGPAGAIDVCSAEAPRLAAAATTPTLRIGRATTRPRNPANAATGWQAEAIAHFEAMPASERGLAPFTRPLPNGALAYATPLIASGVCLLCHGTAIAPDVAAAIAARYPDDQATGYADGDLRGISWAEASAQ